MGGPAGIEQRHRLAVLAARVVSAEPGERERVLEEATAGEPGLRAEVRRLIEGASGEEGDRLGDLLGELGEVFQQAMGEGDPLDQSGEVLDRYALVRRLGCGAYGSVYLAEQRWPVERRVALKLLHPGVGSPRVLRRFELERRVLASLEHPGIARLLDAGAAPDGRPYFVMDLIEGPGLLEGCGERGLTLGERVALMAGVCDAVQHAHGRGVIHRDLKPGNIVIAPGEPARGVVIDFGVARLLDPGDEHALTSLGHAVGTRRYMSPEQRAGESGDVRSDVYALGVTLGEVVSGGDDGGASRVAARELGWIEGRCCEQDPARRYQSVAELGADLRRWLAREPLAAAPPSAVYRAGRLVRRHPWPCALAGVVVAAGVGLGVSDRVARERLEREVSEQRALILATIDDVLDEVWVFVGTEGARERMVEGLMGRTEALLARRPEDPGLLRAKARLLIQRGHVLNDLTRFEEQEAACREAVGIYERLTRAGPASVELAREHAEAVVRVGDSMRLRDDNEGSEAWFRKAHAMLEVTLAAWPGHLGVRDDLYWSRDRLMWFMPFERRAPGLLEGLAQAEALLGDDPTRVLSRYAVQNAHYRLGHWYCTAKARDLDLARSHLGQAEAMGRALAALQPGRHAFEHMHLESLRMLVRCEDLAGNPEAARRWMDQARREVGMMEARAHGSWSVLNAVLATHVDLGWRYRRLGELDLARWHAERAAWLCDHSRMRGIPRHAAELEKQRAWAQRILDDDAGP